MHEQNTAAKHKQKKYKMTNLFTQREAEFITIILAIDPELLRPYLNTLEHLESKFGIIPDYLYHVLMTVMKDMHERGKLPNKTEAFCSLLSNIEIDIESRSIHIQTVINPENN